eukprot:TRINITY_DN11659_c0_g2_i1.p1 TRINITY_DN11659_c0_g2~~TRINITY_DN11659_c0_g2_i1.p1  ORF type:complete len:550 (+),score=109.96 TRINITY_DN11659_c0_g2_i1:776-2425(+)
MAESIAMAADQQPLTIGVMGGSFNPIHLGHVLLALTVKQTQPVDKVIVVPVFKHFVKKDLLPFEDRVRMCRLAVQVEGVEISTIEQEVGESNAAMLRALRSKYHSKSGTRLLWVCGDDVFDWIGNGKGQEMMKELDGLIVQRRLHQAESGTDRYFKAPLNESQIAAITANHGLRINFMHGELPHFSSTLVRTSPASWRAFLPQCIATYLADRPDLLSMLHGKPCDGKDAEEQKEEGARKRQRTGSQLAMDSFTSCVMTCISVIHALQSERGRTALALSLGGSARDQLRDAQAATDALLRSLPDTPGESVEGRGMLEELSETKRWLARDRLEVSKHLGGASSSEAAWLWNAALVKKFNARIDVLINCCEQCLISLVWANGKPSGTSRTEALPDEAGERLLLSWQQWVKGKEALGRERAFVCAAGTNASLLVRSSFRIRRRLNEIIEHKERMLERIFSLEASIPGRPSTSEALHKMLASIVAMEFALMGCFAPGTPLPMVHDLLASGSALNGTGEEVDLESWFRTTSSVMDLMLYEVQALTAVICTPAAFH